MLGTGASPASRCYLSSIGYIVSQFLRVLIIYYFRLVGTKGTDLPPGYVPGSTPLGTLCFGYFTSGHLL